MENSIKGIEFTISEIYHLKISTTPENWQVVWGNATFDRYAGLVINPASVSASTHETAAALVLCKHPASLNATDFAFRCAMTVDRQLRQGTPPNPWEVGWIGFNWTYDAAGKKKTNFFVAKTNGIQLENSFDEIGETFLFTAPLPTIQVGTYYDIQLIKQGKNLKAWVDGNVVLDITNPNLYNVPGQLAFYSEDAVVRFQNVSFIKTA